MKRITAATIGLTGTLLTSMVMGAGIAHAADPTPPPAGAPAPGPIAAPEAPAQPAPGAPAHAKPKPAKPDAAKPGKAKPEAGAASEMGKPKAGESSDEGAKLPTPTTAANMAPEPDAVVNLAGTEVAKLKELKAQLDELIKVHSNIPAHGLPKLIAEVKMHSKAKALALLKSLDAAIAQVLDNAKPAA